MNHPAKAQTVQQQQVKLLARLYTTQIADLAVRLAQEAGEEVTRPLREAQLLRALNVLAAEMRLIGPHLDEML